jgi:hypothetical protein
MGPKIKPGSSTKPILLAISNAKSSHLLEVYNGLTSTQLEEALRCLRHAHFLGHPINIFLGGFLGWFDLQLQQVTGAWDSHRHLDESSPNMDER